VKGAIYRNQKYDAKYTPANLTRDLTVKLPHMTQRFVAVTPMLVASETSVKQVLDGAGVATIHYPFYLAFGRELFALQRREISGESLAKEAAVLIAKWKARGLTEAVLQAVRTDVFGVVAPVAP
jgi:hypothetical protein